MKPEDFPEGEGVWKICYHTARPIEAHTIEINCRYCGGVMELDLLPEMIYGVYGITSVNGIRQYRVVIPVNEAEGDEYDEELIFTADDSMMDWFEVVTEEKAEHGE